ncbi:hypothetical protein NHQ30_002587 [Ciborinia camelliae]|nr:hypothetical protein NHQ30_002587 [Ciborinia camelliae]
MSDLHYPTASPAMVKGIMDTPVLLSLDDYNDTVGVVIGSGEDQILLNFAAKVLGLQSEFFRVKTEFDSFLPHANHQRPIIDLSEQNVGAMTTFFAWNTTGDIFSARQLSTIMVHDGTRTTRTTKEFDDYRVLWDQLLECYFLAAFLGAPNFGNDIIDALFDIITCEKADDRHILAMNSERNGAADPPTPPPEVDNNHDDENEDDENDDDENDNDNGLWRSWRDPFEDRVPQKEVRQMLGTLSYQVSRMYSKTKAGSPLRRMFIDMIISLAINNEEHYEKLHGIVEVGSPVQFHKDLVDGLMRTANIAIVGYETHRLRADRRTENRCFYHIHKLGETCRVNLH